MKRQKTPPTKTPFPAGCSHAGHAHGAGRRPAVGPVALDRAARLFRAMGDADRLRILQHLAAGECFVTEFQRGDDELIGKRGSVQERERRVAVKLYIGRFR